MRYILPMEAIIKSDFLSVNSKQQQCCYLQFVFTEVEALTNNWKVIEAIGKHWWAADI